MNILKNNYKIVRNPEGKWEFAIIPKKFSPIYRDSAIMYMNNFSPLFEEAKIKSEFEFILTLLRFRGKQNEGPDTWENTRSVINSLMKLMRKIKDYETRRYLSLWLYCHIVEASEPYEITANPINIVNGKRYNRNNFPDEQRGRYTIPLSIGKKIDKLDELFNEINMPNSIFPFNDVFDRDLRNAISHSDFALHGGEVRIHKGTRKIYSHDETEALINKALAYFRAFEFLISFHISEYQTPKIISVHPEFSEDPKERAITIIRKGYGLVGIKDNWTEEELRKRQIPFRLGRFYRHELDLLKKDPFLTILPSYKNKTPFKS